VFVIADIVVFSVLRSTLTRLQGKARLFSRRFGW
jgi:hypothetical protein